MVRATTRPRAGGRPRPMRAAAGAVAGVLLAAPGWAGDAPCRSGELVKLLPIESAAGDETGHAVAVSGTVAVVSSFRHDGTAPDTGLVSVFRYDGTVWGWEAALSPADLEEGDEFGWSVATSGDLIVVGMFQDDDAGSNAGAAYVFRHGADGWEQEAKLTASDADHCDEFGYSVAVEDDVILVSGWLDDDIFINSGSVYVFRFNGASWVEETKLRAGDPGTSDEFGRSVALDGDVVVIGSFRDNDDGLDSGSTYVFRYDGATWMQETKITASDAATDDRFGFSVAVSSDLVLIGAYRDDDRGESSGSAYFFRKVENTWVEEAKVTASDGATDDWFGFAVALTGETAVIGAPLNDERAGNAGATYVFTNLSGSWTETAKLLASDLATSDRLGVSVAASGSIAASGAPSVADGKQPGAAYLFGGLSDCNETGRLDICELVDGTSFDCNRNGVPDECESLPCLRADIDCSGEVDLQDLLRLLIRWGPCEACREDIDGNGVVGFSDLLILLGAWGSCNGPAQPLG